MGKQATIRDVAAAAGVSRQTVSRAFNDKGEISEATRGRILTLAQEMGYRPSNVARSLSTKRTNTVGLLIPDITHHFFSHLVRGAEEVSSAAGYNLFLVNTFRQDERQATGLDAMWDQRVDGAILYGSFLSTAQLQERVRRIRHSVLINCEADLSTSDRAAIINVDDQEGARQAVAHLIAGGRKRIAMLSFQTHSLSGRRRVLGYRQALAENGLPVDEQLIRECKLETMDGYEDAVTLLRERTDIDAILAHNDAVAVNAMHGCMDLGYTVPADIAVIGFDDSPLASLSRPSLTAVRIDNQELGRLAMRSLLALIDGGEDAVPAEQIVTPHLVVRNSAMY